MLNKTERAIMTVIYEKCLSSGACIISTAEIKAKLKSRALSDLKIKTVLRSLELDDYYVLTLCDKNGEEFFCVNLLAKGYAFRRETEQARRAFIYKIFLACLTALVTYVVGRILFLIF